MKIRLINPITYQIEDQGCRAIVTLEVGSEGVGAGEQRFYFPGIKLTLTIADEKDYVWLTKI